MKIPNLNLLQKIRRAGANPKMERTHYGIKIYLPENLTERTLLNSLAVIPADAYKLPEEQGIALDFAGRSCSKGLILHMINSIVWEKGIKIVAWLSKNEETIKLFKAVGLSVTEPAAKIESAKNSDGAKKYVSGFRVVYNSMRSGQRIDTEGDVLLWGHLNPGAEISAGGCIIVAGRLLGITHAGCYGRNDVFVWAGCFETPQVRIANKLCYADANSTSCWRKSVLITLENNTPVIRENKFLTGDTKNRGGNF